MLGVSYSNMYIPVMHEAVYTSERIASGCIAFVMLKKSTFVKQKLIKQYAAAC